MFSHCNPGLLVFMISLLLAPQEAEKKSRAASEQKSGQPARLEFRLAVDCHEDKDRTSQAAASVKGVVTSKKLLEAKVPEKCEWLELSESQCLRLEFLEKSQAGVVNKNQELAGFHKYAVQNFVCFHVPSERKHFILTRVPDANERVTESDLSELQTEGTTEQGAVVLRLKPPADQRFAELTKAGVHGTMVLVLDKKVVFSAYLTQPLRSELHISFGGAEKTKHKQEFLELLKDVLPKVQQQRQ
jgi:hypothetical protein